jgi:hypothetical protein
MNAHELFANGGVCERGNTLLLNDDGAAVLIVKAPHGPTLFATYNPADYPSFNIWLDVSPVEELKRKLQKDCSGFRVVKNALGLVEDPDCEGYLP